MQKGKDRFKNDIKSFDEIKIKRKTVNMFLPKLTAVKSWR